MAEMDFKAASSTMEALARISVSISLFCSVFFFGVCVCLHWFDEIDAAAPVFPHRSFRCSLCVCEDGDHMTARSVSIRRRIVATRLRVSSARRCQSFEKPK